MLLVLPMKLLRNQVVQMASPLCLCDRFEFLSDLPSSWQSSSFFQLPLLFQKLERNVISLSNGFQGYRCGGRLSSQIHQRSETISGFFTKFQLLDCLKSFIQILNDIIDIFRSDRETDSVRFDTLIQKFFLCALAVGGGCRMDNQ